MPNHHEIIEFPLPKAPKYETPVIIVTMTIARSIRFELSLWNTIISYNLKISQIISRSKSENINGCIIFHLEIAIIFISAVGQKTRKQRGLAERFRINTDSNNGSAIKATITSIVVTLFWFAFLECI